MDAKEIKSREEFDKALSQGCCPAAESTFGFEPEIRTYFCVTDYYEIMEIKVTIPHNYDPFNRLDDIELIDQKYIDYFTLYVKGKSLRSLENHNLIFKTRREAVGRSLELASESLKVIKRTYDRLSELVHERGKELHELFVQEQFPDGVHARFPNLKLD